MSLINANAVNRRSFLKGVGGATAVAATVSFPSMVFGQSSSTGVADTPMEIFTAALVAEDLATVFYYNGLMGEVIQDPNLAGPGGTAMNISPSGSAGNVAYLRAAITEEVTHGSLFRQLLGINSYTKDPYQTFYFNPNAFVYLNGFIDTLQTLETAFIGAYMKAIQEFALMAATGQSMSMGGVTYKPSDFAYFAKIAASILGVEAEHRALGRSINPAIIPSNNLDFESTAGLTSVYNGSNSAVAALMPFLQPGNGLIPYPFATAFVNSYYIGIRTGYKVPEE